MLKGLTTYMSEIVGFISVDLVGAGAKYLNTLSAGEGKPLK